MKFIDIVVRDQHGIHLRVASAIAQRIRKYKSEIFISKDNKKSSANSVLGMVLLEATENSKIRVTASGEDEEIAIKEMGEFFTDGAGI